MSERMYKHEEELQDLKKEIIDSLKDKKASRGGFKKSSILMTVVLLLLTLISIAQTVQSATILNKVEEIESSGLDNSATLPDNLENLPDMVGGC